MCHPLLAGACPSLSLLALSSVRVHVAHSATGHCTLTVRPHGKAALTVVPVWRLTQLQGTALQVSPHSKAVPTMPALLRCRSALMPPAGRPSSPERFLSCPGTAKPCPRCSWLVRFLPVTFIAGACVQGIHDQTGIAKSVQPTPGCVAGGYKSRLRWACLRCSQAPNNGAVRRSHSALWHLCLCITAC